MKVPDKFPMGCEFWASFSGDEFVVFPGGGGTFKLSDDGASLLPMRMLPASGCAPMSEDGFVSCAAKLRAGQPSA